MERIKDKGKKFPSQKQDDKNTTIDGEEVSASPDGTHLDDKEEGVSGKKDDRNEIYKEQDEISPDFPSPIDMEEGDEKDDNTERLDDKNRQKAQV